MQILFLTPQLPYPARQGATIRNYNLIRHLAQRHTIDLLTFLAPGEALHGGNPLHSHCRKIATAPQPLRTTAQRAFALVTSLAPDMELRLESAAMHDLTAQFTAAGQYDIVQAEGIEMAQYGLQAASLPGRDASTGARLIFDNHNCEYLLQQRNAFNDLSQTRRWPAACYSLVQWRKLRRYEASVCRRATAVVAVSDADRAALLRIAPDVDLAVVSNGVNVEEYAVASAWSGQSPFKLVFTGKMDYRPNIDAALWFGRQVLPLVRAQVSDVRFQIVGLNPHPRLDELRANPSIEITGAVEDPRPFIQGAAVYVIPMRVGGGTRLKALEAMASGAPIVSTALGVEGIPIEPGRELLLGDEPQAFADAVVRLLADARGGGELRRALGGAARRFVEQRYTWRQIVPKLEAVYLRALGRD